MAMGHRVVLSATAGLPVTEGEETMRSAYRALAYLVAALVGVQAASHAWSSAGTALWVTNGGVLDKSVMESQGPPPFPEVLGYMIHGITGMLVIPVVAVALLVVGLLVRSPRALRFAAAVLTLVVVQVSLGMMGHGLPFLALLHGLNALLLLVVAVEAGRRGLAETAVSRTTTRSTAAVG